MFKVKKEEKKRQLEKRMRDRVGKKITNFELRQ
jgi:hypothetical protein